MLNSEFSSLFLLEFNNNFNAQKCIIYSYSLV